MTMTPQLLTVDAETTLSTKGQLIIPKSIRELHNWDAGQKFTIELTDEGIFLKPKKLFPKTTLEDAAGFFKGHKGKAFTSEEMDEAIAKAIREEWGDNR